MNPYWHFLMTVGEWAQEHHALMLVCWGTIVVVLGGREVLRLMARRMRS
jgi:hypothetical protein